MKPSLTRASGQYFGAAKSTAGVLEALLFLHSSVHAGAVWNLARSVTYAR